jgi:DNA-binding transcriptional LysR family regulator
MIRYTLRQIEYAVLAADLGSVVAAAARSGVAQPSISAAIKKLEEQAGLQIFIRMHAQGVIPTPQGARFLAAARSLLNHAEDVQRFATQEGGSIAGDLLLGCFFTLAPALAPRLIAGFTATHPQVRLRLEEGAQETLLTGLRRGHFDAALLYRVDLPEDVEAVDVARLPPHVLLPAHHPLAEQTSVPILLLRDEPMILLDMEPSRTFFLRLLETAGISPRIAFASPSLEVVRGLVGQGLGYSLLITRPSGDQSYDGQALAVRPIAGEAEPGIISVATLKQVRQTQLVSTFRQFCVKHFALIFPESQ